VVEVSILPFWSPDAEFKNCISFALKLLFKKIISNFLVFKGDKMPRNPHVGHDVKKIKLVFSNFLTIFSKNNLACDDSFILFKKLSLILEQLYLNK